MATELYGRSKTTVRSLSRGLNQAAVLRVDDERTIDDVGLLALGTEVQYTDPDLGLVFFGRVISIQKNYQDGEGVTYECADAYRTLAKQPALISNSTRILVEEGLDAQTTLNKILNNLPSGTLPGGYDTSALSGSLIQKQDKAGQAVDTWVDDFMKLTDDVVAEVQPNSGSPKLVLFSYTSRPDVTLELGDYEVVNPTLNGDPLLVRGQHGESNNRKYRGVRVEGCGDWERYVERNLPGTLIATGEPPDSPYFYEFKFPIPEDLAVARYEDSDGTCREETEGLFTIGTRAINPINIRIPNIPIEEENGAYFFRLKIIMGGIFDSSGPPVPVVEGYFTYTGFKGGFAVDKVSTDPKLAGEGLYVWQRNDLYKYVSDDFTIDDTTKLVTIADELYARYSTSPDSAGNLTVHIKGVNSNLVLGARITNSEFNSPRIRSMQIDFVNRNTALTVSDLPVRDAVENARRRSKLATLEANNWYLNADTKPSCMCGGPLFRDEDGDLSGGGGSDEDAGPSWDCNIFGQCVERNDDRGQFNNLADCERVCQERSWDFIPCLGCVPSQDANWGQYQSAADCEADHPEGPFAPEYNCYSTSGVGSPTDHTAGDRSWDCPSGQHVESVTTDAQGGILSVTCS